MIKLILEVTSAELPDLLRVPKIAELLEAGRAAIQADNPQPLGDSSTRQRGRAAFERRATEKGLKARISAQSGGSDLVVDGPSSQRLVRLICSESPRISLRKEWAKPAELVCAYVWLLPTRSRIFLMTYKEAAEVLGEKALASPSFRDHHYYTTVVTTRRQQVMEGYEDRWEIFM
jgi:hypothetical protein